MNRQQRRRMKIEESRTETDKAAMGLRESVDRLLSSGDMRFICECGDKFTQGFLAIAHTFDGHEVVRERRSLGMWHFHDTLDGRSVAEMIWNRLRQDGEDPQRFLERIQSYIAKKEEEMAALDAADEALRAAR